MIVGDWVIAKECLYGLMWEKKNDDTSRVSNKMRAKENSIRGRFSDLTKKKEGGGMEQF